MVGFTEGAVVLICADVMHVIETESSNRPIFFIADIDLPAKYNYSEKIGNEFLYFLAIADVVFSE
jgi:hypothetical protein